ncbi:hypothetical protein H5410_036738 [Solanum commersonii]|uniref:Uncharacterized protein n=1 Tax=Solanum commersonii TaxID=4109 RepID=A0A9J5Y643_SOLCO|nr:hypothetical protein H5410_036738 [Solanum commersonii]
MGQVYVLEYVNPDENSMSHVNENQRNHIPVSAIVTRSGKTLPEIIIPDNVDSKGVIIDDESLKGMDKTQIEEVEGNQIKMLEKAEKIKSVMKMSSWCIAEQFCKAVLYRPMIQNAKMLKAKAERR